MKLVKFAMAAIAVSAVALVCASTGAQAFTPPQLNPYYPCTDPPASVPTITQLFPDFPSQWVADAWTAIASPYSSTCFGTSTILGHWFFFDINPALMCSGTPLQLNCSTNNTADLSCFNNYPSSEYPFQEGQGDSFDITYGYQGDQGGVWYVDQSLAHSRNNNGNIGCNTYWTLEFGQDTGHP